MQNSDERCLRRCYRIFGGRSKAGAGSQPSEALRVLRRPWAAERWLEGVLRDYRREAGAVRQEAPDRDLVPDFDP